MGIFTMVLPWYGILVPWFYRGITVVSPQYGYFYHGFSMVWNSCTMVLPRYTTVYFGILRYLFAVHHGIIRSIPSYGNFDTMVVQFVERDLYHGNTVICISCAMVKHGKWCQVYHGMQLLYFN